MNKQGYGARERIVVPLLFPLLTGALLVAAAFVDAATPTTGPGVDLAPGAGWTFAALGLAFGICGGVVLRFDPRQRFGWLLGGFGLFWGLDGLAQSWVRFGIRSDEALAGVGTALWFLNRFGAFLPMTVAALLLIFPTGTFLPGRWGVAGRSALGAMAAAAMFVVVAPANGRLLDVDLPPGVDLDAGALPLPGSIADLVLPVANTLTIIGVLIAMATVVVRHRRAVGAERDRTRWLLWSVEVGAVALALSLLTGFTVISDVVLFVVAVLPAVAVTIGIVRPTLVPVQDLLNGTLVFALLSLSLVVVDLAGRRRPQCRPRRQPRRAPGRRGRAAADDRAVRAVAPTPVRHRAATGPRPARGAVRRRGGVGLHPRARRRGRRAAGRGDRRRGGRVRDRVRAAGGRPGQRRTHDGHARCRTGRGAHAPHHLPRAGGRPRGAAGAGVAQPAEPARRAAAGRPGPPGGQRGADRPARRGAPGEPRATGARPRGGAPPDPARPPRRARSVAERRRLPAGVRPAARRQGPRRRPPHPRVAQRARAGDRRRRAPARPRPAAAGPRRPRPGRRARPAGRADHRHRRTRGDRGGRRPRVRSRPRSRWRRTGSSARP